jgi:DNA-binding transcriptional LysR family regulator
MMKKITVTNLETLCAIARLGTFQAAADKLNTTQPAISARMRDLETIIGRPLFQRYGRRMELSLEGRQIVERAEPLLGTLGELLVSLENPSAAVGLIRIGLGEIIARTWFPRFVSEAMNLMPNLRFDVQIDLNIPSRQDLENGKLDIALLGDIGSSGALALAPLGSIQTSWLGSPALVGKDARRMPLVDLLTQHPVWSLSKASIVYPIMAAQLGSVRSKVNFNMCDNISALIGLLTDGAGIGMLPEVLVKEQLESGELVRLGRGNTGTRLPFFVTWRCDEKQVAVLKLVELARRMSTFA